MEVLYVVLHGHYICSVMNFRFSIDRSSDPRRHFSVGAISGIVTLRRPLDRETQERHVVYIRAIDKGLSVVKARILHTSHLKYLVESFLVRGNELKDLIWF